MAESSEREELVLDGNVCFGCGEANAHGLQVSVYTDPEAPDQLLGEFRPSPEFVGLPGITHGGTIYTAMDCMATWSGMALKRTKAMWVLRSATTTYHQPAFQADPIFPSARIGQDGGDWDAIQVRVEARNPEGDLLVEGTFKAIPLPPERFKALVRTDALPAAWNEWLGEPAQEQTSPGGTPDAW